MAPDPAPKRVSRARTMIGTRMTTAEIATIDALAARRGITRGEWIRKALKRVIEAERGKGGGTGTPGTGN